MGYKIRIAPKKFKPIFKYQIVDEKSRRHGMRTRSELRILKCFTYKGITGLDCMTMEVYDKKLKRMFVFTSKESSSWSYKEKLKQLKKVGLKPLDKR